MPTLLDITIDKIEVTSIRTINPRAMPTILRRIDWLKIGIGAGQRLKDGWNSIQWNGPQEHRLSSRFGPRTTVARVLIVNKG
jgi:hypothetical protein